MSTVLVMRASRLLAIVMRLQHSGPVTADAMAADLEVSVRTIYRDVTELQAAGVPVWTTPGTGGGIRIDPGWTSPVDGMTADETAALMLGEMSAPGIGLARALTTARSRIRSAVSPEASDLLTLLAGRIRHDSEDWFRSPPPAPPPHVSQIAAAVLDNHRIQFGYATAGAVRRRRVDPLGLVNKAGNWYLVALHRRRVRVYRASRIDTVKLLDETAHRRDDFDLARYWSDASRSFEASLRTLDATLGFPADQVQQLRRALSGAATDAALATATVRDGRIEVNITVEPLEIAAAQLASVPGIEVITPPSLRRAVADHCNRLLALNTDSAGPRPHAGLEHRSGNG